MTPPKKQSYSTTNMKTPICTRMIACDGANLIGNKRLERGMCLKCEDALDKKTKKPKPLKGENSALNEKMRNTLPKNWNSYNPDDE